MIVNDTRMSGGLFDSSTMMERRGSGNREE